MQTNDLCSIELLEIELFEYLNCVKTNDWCLIKLLLLDSNNLNHLNLLTYANMNC